MKTKIKSISDCIEILSEVDSIAIRRLRWVVTNYKLDDIVIEYVINNHLSEVEPDTILCTLNISDVIIEKYINLFNWYNISRYGILSEYFIEKYHDKVIWSEIIIYQTLSYNFILNNIYRFNLYECQVSVNIDKLERIINGNKDKYEIDKMIYKMNNDGGEVFEFFY